MILTKTAGFDICEYLADCAFKAMIYEAGATPKPGLVDVSSNGAHHDMDYPMFVNSAIAIRPYMKKLCRKALEYLDASRADLMSAVKEVGLEAEKAMYLHTENVNTHKGSIFSLGILCVSAARVYYKNKSLEIEPVLHGVKWLTEGIVQRELHSLKSLSPQELARKKLTAGERLYLQYGAEGIRGEAEGGFRTVVEYALPVFEKYVSEGALFNDALVEALLFLMKNAQDTNVLARGGKKGQEIVRQQAEQAILSGGMHTEQGRKKISEMDQLFVEKNLSPGGCADLLAVTVMLHLLRTQIKTARNLY
ncbi:MAG: triphosphoribosyl-dephospho-CoA synthase CitG [Peptococcaceae bacterium]